MDVSLLGLCVKVGASEWVCTKENVGGSGLGCESVVISGQDVCGPVFTCMREWERVYLDGVCERERACMDESVWSA